LNVLGRGHVLRSISAVISPFLGPLRAALLGVLVMTATLVMRGLLLRLVCVLPLRIAVSLILTTVARAVVPLLVRTGIMSARTIAAVGVPTASPSPRVIIMAATTRPRRI
jgi:hypothetical protein